MKKLLALVLAAAMLLGLSTVAFAEDTETIKVGINAEFPPFEYYEDGKLTGFDIELMNRIGEILGCKIEYVNLAFDALFTAVEQGEVDCGISAITATEQRKAVFGFTRPYITVKMTYPDGDATVESTESYAILLQKENSALYDKLETAIRVATADGTIATLAEKYGLNTDETAATVPAPSDWAAESIDKAQTFNITEKATNYDYANPITREEFCELVYNLILSVKQELTVLTSNSFTDTANRKVLALNGLGIINGKTETEFAPDDLLTRQEAAVILVRMINRLMPMPATEMWFAFDDVDTIADWARDGVQTICNLGFMNGVGDNRFAPQESYTTEQAIATLVRIYEAQQPVDNADPADNEEFEKFLLQITENTVAVDGFYLDEALKLAQKAGSLAATKEFVALYVGDGEVQEGIEAIGKVDYTTPEAIFYLSFNRETVADYYKALYAAEGIDADFDTLMELNRFDLGVLAGTFNGRYGAKTIAATTALSTREGYIMPEGFDKDFGLFLAYDGEYSALVNFTQIGEGVIEGRMQFVKNGDKQDLLSYLSEVYDAFGEECLTIGKVE